MNPLCGKSERRTLIYPEHSRNGGSTARKHANSFAGLESGVSRAIKNARGGSTAVVDSVAGVFAGAFIKSVRAAGGDEAAAAGGLVEGVMVWAGEAGIDAARAAAVAGQSAVDAAYDADARTGRKVRDVLKAGIAGVEIALKKR